MKHLLFVNACPRGEQSRTLKLASAFLEELRSLGGVEVAVQNLPDMHLSSVDAQTLSMKEALCDRHAWDDPFFAPALAFQQADAVVVAAPYWDMSFPSILKIWVENMYVRNLTFRYENDQPIGLCSGKEAVYITTAGSPIGPNDWGTMYIRAVMNTLGISGFSCLKAESLDLASSNVQAIMSSALQDAEKAGHALAQRLQA